MKKEVEATETVVLDEVTVASVSAPASSRGLRYVGQEYIHGVPARDLTPAEAAEYGEIIAATRAATGRILYEEA